MKRIIIYVLILIALLFVPVKDNDIGKLQPVEVVQVYRQGQQVTIRTDTGDLGVGNTAQLALQNLKDTTPGYIYLDTAEYLLIEASAEAEVDGIRHELKKAVRICSVADSVDLKSAAQYLSVHGALPSLREWSRDKICRFCTQKTTD